MGILKQCLGTAIISCSAINMGIAFTWPAFTLTPFASTTTPLNRPMTVTEMSLFASLSSIGGMISTPTAGFLLDKIGRKYCSIINAVLLTIFWVLLTCSRQVEVVLAAIFLSGVSSSIYLVTPVYISEICQDSIRGTMTSINTVCFGLGMLIAYLLGGYLPYNIVLYISLALSAFGLAVLLLLKDSPIHLLSSGREEDAKNALAYYRGVKSSSKEIFEELSTMKRTLNADLDEDATPEEEKLQPLEKKPKQKLSTWQFFKKSKSTQRAMFVCIVIMTAANFQGLMIVQIYAEVLFADILPSISPSICSVLLATTLVVAGMVGALLTDRVGRRSLIIYSTIASGISCIVLGTQIHVEWGPNWLTAVFMFVFPMTTVFGASTVPYVLMAELFLPEVKSIVTMIIMEWMWLCNFVLLFVFNHVLRAIGWGPVFYIFATVCFFTSAFCFKYLPETKLLSVEMIQTLFVNKRKLEQVNV